MAARWIITSLCLHLLFFVLGLSSANRRTPGPNPPTDSPPIEVTQIVPDLKAIGPRGRSGRGAGTLSLRDLGIRGSHGIPSDLIEDLNGEVQPEDLGLLGEAKHAVAYDRLYRRIDEALYYPPEFKQAEVEGVVKADLVFSKAGKYERRFSRIDSRSPYLRVLVVRILEHALDEPIPPKWRTLGHFSVRCVFFFDLTRKDNPLDKAESAMDGHVKNRAFGREFAFYRSAKLIGEWSLGPLHGYGIVPSVGVDSEWFVDKATDLVSDKEKVDPLAKYRSDPEFDREG